MQNNNNATNLTRLVIGESAQMADPASQVCTCITDRMTVRYKGHAGVPSLARRRKTPCSYGSRKRRSLRESKQSSRTHTAITLATPMRLFFKSPLVFSSVREPLLHLTCLGPRFRANWRSKANIFAEKRPEHTKLHTWEPPRVTASEFGKPNFNTDGPVPDT